MLEPDPRTLRSQMRRRRRALTAKDRAAAASELCRALGSSREFRNAHHIAAYLPHDGEIDLRPLIARAWCWGKHIWLPALHDSKLRFVPYGSDSVLRCNRFHIEEPVVPPGVWIKARSLDLVLMPLTAFDQAGHRLGMGGGYYDQTFTFLRIRSRWRKPDLVGVAYDFQQVPKLKQRPWDVSMDGIATPDGIRRFPPVN